MSLGVHLTLLIGPTIAVPAPPLFTEALRSVEVTHNDEKRSGFQITFEADRSGPMGLLDYPLLSNPLLKPFNRVVIVVTFNATPRVLMDGIITHQELSPGQGGSTTLTVTGEDISILMDQNDLTAEHPGMPDAAIVSKIILQYMQYGILPMIIPPPLFSPPLPVERTPTQQDTDLTYLNLLAERNGYVFYLSPGPFPMQSVAYWGPPIHVGLPQRALSVELGSETNVDSISFRYNALRPTTVSGAVQDRLTNQKVPIKTLFSTRPPLALFPAVLANQPYVRNQQLRESGLDAIQALARAQGQTDRASDAAVTAEGELNALRYGDLLQARGLVGLRGAGFNHDGLWYVQSVTHSIKREQYTQRFTLAREGVGSTTPVVQP